MLNLDIPSCAVKPVNSKSLARRQYLRHTNVNGLLLHILGLLSCQSRRGYSEVIKSRATYHIRRLDLSYRVVISASTGWEGETSKKKEELILYLDTYPPASPSD